MAQNPKKPSQVLDNTTVRSKKNCVVEAYYDPERDELVVNHPQLTQGECAAHWFKG
jgi:hypothetical protein